MKSNAAQQPFILDEHQRKQVEISFKETCIARKYELIAVNARTNHVHAVVSAQSKPEPIMNGFKGYATRKLREDGLVSIEEKIWSRGGSRKYLWKERFVTLAIDYVLYGQGPLPFELEQLPS